MHINHVLAGESKGIKPLLLLPLPSLGLDDSDARTLDVDAAEPAEGSPKLAATPAYKLRSSTNRADQADKLPISTFENLGSKHR